MSATERVKRSGIDVPRSWLRPDILLASLGINLLALAMPIVVLQTYDRIIPNLATDSFLILIGGVVLVILLEMVLKMLRAAQLAWSGARFEHATGLKLFARILGADSSAYGQQSQGYYLSRLQAVDELQRFYAGQSMLLLLDLPFALLFLILLYYIGGHLVLVPLCLGGVFVLVTLAAGGRLQRGLVSSRTHEEQGQSFLIEALTNIHTIKSTAMEAQMVRRYERLQARAATTVTEMAHLNSLTQGLGSTFSQAAIVLVVSVGAMSVVAGDMTVGALAAATMLAGRALQPLVRAAGLWSQLRSVSLARGQAGELAALPQEVSGERDSGQVQGGLSAESLRLRQGAGSALLDAGQLTLRAGEMVAITGRRGAGKSSLLRVLAGLELPEQGRVLLDGRPLTEYRVEALRNAVAYIPQSGTLFEGTILENMTLFRSGEVVEQALSLARDLGLDAFVARLPEGLDTQVGGMSVDQLSDAVTQKILMVRALVGDPKVILLDDVNASFDLQADARLIALLQRLKGQRTLVIVSNRPSFLRICDRAFELGNGRLTALKRRREIQPQPVPTEVMADG